MLRMLLLWLFVVCGATVNFFILFLCFFGQFAYIERRVGCYGGIVMSEKLLFINSLASDELLVLQDSFFQPGFHLVVVPSCSFGRSLMRTFAFCSRTCLSVACLSDDSFFMIEGVVPLFDGIPTVAYVDSYLLCDFFYELCWIEYTPELFSSPWFRHFSRRVYDFNLTNASSFVVFIPIC